MMSGMSFLKISWDFFGQSFPAFGEGSSPNQESWNDFNIFLR